MSHYTILIIGDNIEQQLQPFHEFECTGHDDQYVKDTDITQEIPDHMKEKSCTLNDALEYHGLSDLTVHDESKLDKKKHKYGYVLINKDSSIGKAVRRTNPDAKWDWWQIGGRWTGFFKLKAGKDGKVGKPGIMTDQAQKGFADSVKKSDIDFESMRNDAGDKAAKEYDEFHAVIKGRALKPWPEFMLDFGKDIEAARKAWHEHPVAMDISKWLTDTNRYPLMETDELLKRTREQHIQSARNYACVTFAVLKDGKWYERGQMGWWGIVSNESDSDSWAQEFSKLIDDLPDDTLLTIVDCHI